MGTPELLASLRSDICPSCGGRKKTRQSLCRTCYYRLPRDERRRLYAKVGDGYEEAFADCMTILSERGAIER